MGFFIKNLAQLKRNMKMNNNNNKSKNDMNTLL